MSEFKVGDKVRRIKDNHGGMKKGDIGTVVSSDSIDTELKEFGDSGVTHMTSNLELVKKGKQPKVTHLIIYDLTDRDPVIYCYSSKELKKELSKLYDNSDVIQSSIKVYEIKKVFETKNNVSLREVK